MAEVIKILGMDVPAGTNITGFAPYQGLDFLSEQVQIVYSGLNMLKGLIPMADIDVYPGVNPNSGDIKFMRDLVAGEAVKMMTYTSYPYVACLLAPQYAPEDRKLELQVWLEQNGQITETPMAAGVRLFMEGALVRAYSDLYNPNALGIFTFVDNSIDLVRNKTYITELSIVPSLSEPVVKSLRSFILL